MNNLMRAVGFRPPGLVENLFIESREIPALKQNECLIKVVYSALNRADTLQRKGLYPPPPGDSDILGLEAVGYVTKCETWPIGSRVMALVGGGGNAEYVAVNEKNLIKIPEWMSFREAAAIPEAWLTAFQLLYWISNLTRTSENIEDKKVLVHAGASGVGTSLIQMLKKVLKIKNVFSTVGSEEKKSYLEKELNVTRAFNYKQETEANFDKLILEITENKGVDLVFDCIGGSYWEKNSNCLGIDSEWILYGSMGGAQVNGDLLGKILRKRIQLKGSTLRTRSIQYKHDLMRDFEDKILNKFNKYNLKAIIDQQFDLQQITEAHARMESNQNIGKILLKIANEQDLEVKFESKNYKL